jgi:single-strand DNA-binding protein
LNQQIIKGRLTHNPEFKKIDTVNGMTALCTFSVAVDRTYGEETDFFNCVAWRKTAEFVDKFFTKGKEILVIGSMQMDKVLKDDETRTYWKLNVERVEFCGKKSDTPTSDSSRADLSAMSVPKDDGDEILPWDVE